MRRFVANVLTCICANCGSIFYRYKSGIYIRTFCSKECYQEWRRKNKEMNAMIVPKLRVGDLPEKERKALMEKIGRGFI